jgi:hypothetical protein
MREVAEKTAVNIQMPRLQLPKSLAVVKLAIQQFSKVISM